MNPDFVSTFGNLQGEEVKTAPKGFEKNHPGHRPNQKKAILCTAFLYR